MYENNGIILDEGDNFHISQNDLYYENNGIIYKSTITINEKGYDVVKKGVNAYKEEKLVLNNGKNILRVRNNLTIF